MLFSNVGLVPNDRAWHRTVSNLYSGLLASESLECKYFLIRIDHQNSIELIDLFSHAYFLFIFYTSHHSCLSLSSIIVQDHPCSFFIFSANSRASNDQRFILAGSLLRVVHPVDEILLFPDKPARVVITFDGTMFPVR